MKMNSNSKVLEQLLSDLRRKRHETDELEHEYQELEGNIHLIEPHFYYSSALYEQDKKKISMLVSFSLDFISKVFHQLTITIFNMK